MIPELILSFAIIFLLVLANGFFVAAEFALAGQVRNRFQISYARGIVTTVSENGGARIETRRKPSVLLGERLPTSAP